MVFKEILIMLCLLAGTANAQTKEAEQHETGILNPDTAFVDDHLKAPSQKRCVTTFAHSCNGKRCSRENSPYNNQQQQAGKEQKSMEKLNPGAGKSANAATRQKLTHNQGLIISSIFFR